MYCGSEPGGLDTAFVKQALALFALDTKAQFAKSVSVPARDELALVAIFAIYRVAQL
jgi:hypothetical protein